MTAAYKALLESISNTYGVSVEQIERRVDSRQRKAFGLIGRGTAARIVSVSLRVAKAEASISAFLAASGRHISGLHLADAMGVVLGESKAGHPSTIGYWPHPHERPNDIAAHYAQAIEEIAASRLDCYLSIKVDQLDFDRRVLLPILELARAHDVRIHFDAQGYETADSALALLEGGLALGVRLSATLPSRWQRSRTDAEQLLAWGLPFRIVKGQGGDPGHPKINPVRAFLELVEQVAGRATHVAVATHDRRVAEPALDRLIRSNTPCSLEQLASLPRLDFVASARRVPVRVYVAYGRFGLPYAIRELVRRPEMLAWAVRDLVVRARRGEDRGR